MGITILIHYNASCVSKKLKANNKNKPKKFKQTTKTLLLRRTQPKPQQAEILRRMLQRKIGSIRSRILPCSAVVAEIRQLKLIPPTRLWKPKDQQRRMQLKPLLKQMQMLETTKVETPRVLKNQQLNKVILKIY